MCEHFAGEICQVALQLGQPLSGKAFRDLLLSLDRQISPRPLTGKRKEVSSQLRDAGTSITVIKEALNESVGSGFGGRSALMPAIPN